MTQNNSSFQLDDKSHQVKRQSISVYFDNNNKQENLPVPDGQNKKHKHRCTIITKKDHDNTTAW